MDFSRNREFSAMSFLKLLLSFAPWISFLIIAHRGGVRTYVDGAHGRSGERGAGGVVLSIVASRRKNIATALA
jgi:hypothetical protein